MGRFRRTAPDLLDNDLVFPDRGPDGVEQSRLIYPYVALDLRFYGIVQRQQPGTGAGIHVGAVELGIEGEEPVGLRLAGRTGTKIVGIEPGKSPDQYPPAGERQLSRPFRRQAFDVPHDLEQLAGILHRQGGHRRPGPPTRCGAGHVALLLQPLQCRSNGRAAGAEPERGLTLVNARARRQAAGHDEIADLDVGLVYQVGQGA